VVKEEKIVFPAIKTLVAKREAGDKSPLEGSLDTAIKLMHEEHDHAGDDLRYFRKITNDYTLPKGACNSYTYLFEKLKEFEDDLFRHIHLENNILFPKAVALEG
jgi:regulator of cell morphogenesis and NO signaling